MTVTPKIKEVSVSPPSTVTTDINEPELIGDWVPDKPFYTENLVQDLNSYLSNADSLLFLELVKDLGYTDLIKALARLLSAALSVHRAISFSKDKHPYSKLTVIIPPGDPESNKSGLHPRMVGIGVETASLLDTCRTRLNQLYGRSVHRTQAGLADTAINFYVSTVLTQVLDAGTLRAIKPLIFRNERLKASIKNHEENVAKGHTRRRYKKSTKPRKPRSKAADKAESKTLNTEEE